MKGNNIIVMSCNMYRHIIYC